MISILLITSLLFLICGVRFLSTSSKLHKQSGLILSTAGLVYLIMSILYFMDTDTNLRTWRYIDWFITVPMMVNQMMSLSYNKGTYNLTYCIITSILMLGFGFVGEAGLFDRSIAGILGTLCALFTFLPLFNQIDRRTNRIYYLIMTGWLFYPIVYFLSDSMNLIIGYSIVDLVVKIGFAQYLYRKLV